jgi:hypothetical protein
MAEKKFDEIQRHLELAVWEIKIAKDPEQIGQIFSEMSRLLAEANRILETSSNPKS